MPPAASGSTTLPRPLRVFARITAALWALCAAIIGCNRFILHWTSPYDTPFFPFTHYEDFYVLRDEILLYHTRGFYIAQGTAYPPPAVMLYALFYLPYHHLHTIFTIVTTIPLAILAFLLVRAMVSLGAATLTAASFVAASLLLSYPFWMEILLGNMEICIFLFVAFAILALLAGHRNLAAILIGVAGSMKLFPFIFLALFLSRRQYRQFALGLLSAAVLYPISVWLECPAFFYALRQIRIKASQFADVLILHWDWVNTSFDHSLFGSYKQIMHLLGFSNTRTAHQLHIYMIAAAFAATALYFLRIRRLPFLNQLLCLSILAVLLPPMSNDYTLMHLYIPWALLTLTALRDARDGRADPALVAAFLCFALLFSPESDLIIRHATINGIFKTVTLVSLLFIALKYPFSTPVEAALPWPTHDTLQDAVAAA